MENEPTVVAPAPNVGGPWAKFQPRVLLPVFLAAVVVILMAVHFLGLLFTTPKETPQEAAARKVAQQYEQTTPTSPVDVNSFAVRTAKAADDRAKEAATAAKLAGLMAQGVNTLGTANAANPLAVPGMPSNTDPKLYKQWVDADSAARASAQYGSSPYLSPANGMPGQQPPNAPGPTTPSPADEKREAAKKRDQQRLMASSMAIDFTKEGEKRETVRPDAEPHTAATQSSSNPLFTPVLTSEQDKEPHVLKAHTCTDLCEGDLIETVLTNRVDGSQAGFADVMVTQPVFSHAWDVKGRRLLIPVGSRVLGNVTAVSGSQQQRLFVAFHKIRRPDGSTFSLDNFTGLDMAGSSGLRDLVNHHYLQTFGIAGAIAAIGAVSQVGNSTSGLAFDPGVSMRNGLSQGLSQESQQVLNKYLSQAPTMVVREGRNLVKVYISQDLTLPEYAPKEVADAR